MEIILEQFPKWQAEIKQLALESTDFRELCQDYEEVRRFVDAWTNSKEISQATIAEYQDLLKDLETEIVDDLEARFRPASMPTQNSSSQAPGFGGREEGE